MTSKSDSLVLIMIYYLSTYIFENIGFKYSHKPALVIEFIDPVARMNISVDDRI